MINFPDAPAIGNVFTAARLAWRWDGGKWIALGGTAPADIVYGVVEVTGSVTLPDSAEGTVNVENSTGAPITITLPVAPAPGQALKIKDCLGNAGTHPVTITSTVGLIDGYPTYQLAGDYMAIELYWMDSQWGTR